MKPVRTPPTRQQLELLARMHAGAALIRLDRYVGRWHLRHGDPRLDPSTSPVNNGTAQGLVARGFIETDGMLGWRITDAGHAALKRWKP